MIIKVTDLRADLYQLLDRVLQTGEAIEVERKGRRLRISAVSPLNKLECLVPHPDDLTGDPDDLTHIDWSSEWRP